MVWKQAKDRREKVMGECRGMDEGAGMLEKKVIWEVRAILKRLRTAWGTSHRVVRLMLCSSC